MKCPDSSKRNEYELRANTLNKKMKAKANQINKLKIVQKNKVSELRAFLFLLYLITKLFP